MNSESTDSNNPKQTHFRKQATLTKQHCPEHIFCFWQLWFQSLSRKAFSGRKTLKYLKKAQIHAGFYVAHALYFISPFTFYPPYQPD